ncbi:UNVERIFIED_CONTAM: hypothetical protein K2H54_076710, partial [Gekko kuhli]
MGLISEFRIAPSLAVKLKQLGLFLFVIFFYISKFRRVFFPSLRVGTQTWVTKSLWQ